MITGPISMCQCLEAIRLSCGMLVAVKPKGSKLSLGGSKDRILSRKVKGKNVYVGVQCRLLCGALPIFGNKVE